MGWFFEDEPEKQLKRGLLESDSAFARRVRRAGASAGSERGAWAREVLREEASRKAKEERRKHERHEKLMGIKEQQRRRAEDKKRREGLNGWLD